jgi:hypothetical protein
MTIRSFSRPLVALLVTCAVGCGGPAKPADEPASTDAASSSPSEPADEAGGNGERPTAEGAETPSAAPAKEEAKVAEGLQLLDKRSLSLDYAFTLSQKDAGKGIDSGSWSFAEERTMRVKAAKKGVITEMQVVFGKWEAKPLLGLTYESPTNGKTYLLSDKGGSIDIIRGNNEKTSADEQAAIKFEYGWVGTVSPLRLALLDANLKIGTELPKSAVLTQILLGSLPGIDPGQTEVTAVIDKVDSGAKKKVTLKTTAKTRIVSNKTFLDLELSGNTSVDLNTGWVLGSELSGTIKGGGTRTVKKHGELDVAGKGKVTYSRSSEFK